MRVVGCLTMAMLAAAVCASDADSFQSYEAGELRGMTALEFLTELCSSPRGHVIIRDTVPDWPAVAELAALRPLTNDPTPCRSVADARSSYLDDGRSTRGVEATFLILGIRAGAYPPALNSTRIRKDVGEALRRAERVSNGAQPPPR